jgi:hypothetical protein
MARPTCPKCGHQSESEGQTCPDCGHALNGTPAVPSGKLPPELREWARQTFNPEEFLADLREVERTGGRELIDFIHELEQEATRE